MDQALPLTCTAFLEGRRLATGPLHEVAVHEARRKGGDRHRTRQARDRAYHAMSTLAGNLAGFVEASRALFAGDHERLVAQMAAWPADVRAYVQQLAEPAPG